MTTERILLGTAIVIFAIVVVALAQGIGESVGHGLREWMVR